MGIYEFLLIFTTVFVFLLCYFWLVMRREYADALLYAARVPIDAKDYHMALRILNNLATNAEVRSPLLVFEHSSDDLKIDIYSYTKRLSVIKASASLAGTLSEEEWRGVFGHELGHLCSGFFFTNALLEKSVFFSARFSLLCVAVILSMDSVFAAFGGSISFPTFLYNVVAVVMFIFTALFAVDCVFYSFLRRGEFFADRFSVNLTGEKRGLLSILSMVEKYEEKKYHRRIRVFEHELIQRHGEHSVSVALFRLSLFFKSLRYTHPDTRERVRRIEAL